MGYSVIRGGSEAMLAAEAMLDFVRLGGLDATKNPDAELSTSVEAVLRTQRLAVARVMSEGGLYAPRLAAIALVQAEGDAIEASFILRAYRASLPRWGSAQPADSAAMRIIRRVSSAFKDVPGGQFLGPTRDYTLRFLREELAGEVGAERLATVIAELGDDDAPLPEMPRVISLLREAGLVRARKVGPEVQPVDITMTPLRFPNPPRSARLQALARGEAGMMNGLAYSSLRGYGHVHPTLGEFRVGHVDVTVQHPIWGGDVSIGEVLLTECDAVVTGIGMVSAVEGEKRILLELGYGASFGQQEGKAISMAILDACISQPEGDGPADDIEFVLYHIDGVESSGFVDHLKQPHYTLFASVMDRLDAANARRVGSAESETTHESEQSSLTQEVAS